MEIAQEEWRLELCSFTYKYKHFKHLGRTLNNFLYLFRYLISNKLKLQS